MKKIACIGHHCTGAGVIDDLLRECDNVAQAKYETEFRLLQDADGISDLEYNLVENPTRLYSGFALKRFLLYIKSVGRGYKKLFGQEYYKFAEDYVNGLAKFQYKGAGFLDFTLEPWYGKMYYWGKRAWHKICKMNGWKRNMDFLPWVRSYHAICTEEEFLQKTRTFVDTLCRQMNPEDKEFLVLDQAFSPQNPSRYVRYINDLKAIIVDRDPRDIFVINARTKEFVLPIGDVHQYCQAYRDNRKIIGTIPENVMRVRFEDMVLHYDEMIPKVLAFLGIDPVHHVAAKRYFNPAISVRGIGGWKNHPEYAEEIKVIETELADMLYDQIPDDDTKKKIMQQGVSKENEEAYKKIS